MTQTCFAVWRSLLLFFCCTYVLYIRACIRIRRTHSVGVDIVHVFVLLLMSCADSGIVCTRGLHCIVLLSLSPLSPPYRPPKRRKYFALILIALTFLQSYGAISSYAAPRGESN